MKKILIYGLTDNLGGMAVFIKNFICSVEKTNIEIHLLVHEKPVFLELLENEGCIFHYVTRRGNGYFKNIKETDEVFKNNSFDVVWLHACTLSYIYPLISAKKYNVKTRIIHSHSTSASGGWLMKSLHNLHKPLIKKYANKYCACSIEAARFFYEDKIIDSKNFEIIKNGVDVDSYKYNEKVREKLRRDLNIDNDDRVIISVGRFAAVKNHKFIVEIFNEVIKKDKAYKLILIGEGQLKEDIINLVEDYKLTDFVKFIGLTSSISDYLSAADLMLIPSLYEGLPFVAVEAQSSGLRVLASDTVSASTKITNLVEFLPLELESKLWADKVIMMTQHSGRVDMKDEMIKEGFDIKTEANLLLNEILSDK